LFSPLSLHILTAFRKIILAYAGKLCVNNLFLSNSREKKSYGELILSTGIKGYKSGVFLRIKIFRARNCILRSILLEAFYMKHFLDVMGEMCPIPIIKAERFLKKLKSGEKLILETDHSCSIQSVTEHFQRKYGYPCKVVEIEEGIWQIEILKKK